MFQMSDVIMDIVRGEKTKHHALLQELHYDNLLNLLATLLYLY